MYGSCGRTPASGSPGEGGNVTRSCSCARRLQLRAQAACMRRGSIDGLICPSMQQLLVLYPAHVYCSSWAGLIEDLPRVKSYLRSSPRACHGGGRGFH